MMGEPIPQGSRLSIDGVSGNTTILSINATTDTKSGQIILRIPSRATALKQHGLRLSTANLTVNISETTDGTPQATLNANGKPLQTVRATHLQNLR